eukprot:TRINITY_DN240_c0_g1_i1.p1 TRINITY_DN240_c0_g1~~TRINITY_DN240_c0_g1_i1.p1  ORF type:complete len:380 (-),score=172.75 TRINITY_DN240_c0_g1_i1:285-1424(-)
MKASTLIVVVFACMCSLALCDLAAAGNKNKFQSTTSVMIQNQANTKQSIDSVLDLLIELKEGEENEQKKADSRNKTEEDEGLTSISQFNELVEKEKKNARQCTEHREVVEKELNQTLTRLEWLEKRFAEIEAFLDKLAEERCRANAIFIANLREHNEALKAIQYLKQEYDTLAGHNELAGVQLKSFTDKLKKYEYMYQEQAVEQLVELSSVSADTTDLTSANVAEKIFTMIAKLEQNLREEMKKFEEHEIKAAYDFINYQGSAEAENSSLASEHDDKRAALQKIKVDLDVALDYEKRCWETYDTAVRALNAALEDLSHKRDFYISQTSRRTLDTEVLQEVIETFQEKILDLGSFMQKKIKEYQSTTLQTRNVNEYKHDI